jgi:hypothetical protein
MMAYNNSPITPQIVHKQTTKNDLFVRFYSRAQQMPSQSCQTELDLSALLEKVSLLDSSAVPVPAPRPKTTKRRPRKPAVVRQKCLATTKRALPCKRYAIGDSSYCKVHQRPASARPPVEEVDSPLSDRLVNDSDSDDPVCSPAESANEYDDEALFGHCSDDE